MKFWRTVIKENQYIWQRMAEDVFVVMDIEDYERDRAEKKLLLKLQEAEEAVKDGEGWLDLEELKALVGE